jgi:hypothetical protein
MLTIRTTWDRLVRHDETDSLPDFCAQISTPKSPGTCPRKSRIAAAIGHSVIVDVDVHDYGDWINCSGSGCLGPGIAGRNRYSSSSRKQSSAGTGGDLRGIGLEFPESSQAGRARISAFAN